MHHLVGVSHFAKYGTYFFVYSRAFNYILIFGKFAVNSLVQYCTIKSKTFEAVPTPAPTQTHPGRPHPSHPGRPHASPNTKPSRPAPPQPQHKTIPDSSFVLYNSSIYRTQKIQTQNNLNQKHTEILVQKSRNTHVMYLNIYLVNYVN